MSWRLVSAFSIIRTGVDRDNFTDTDDLWNVADSKPFYRATIGAYHYFKNQIKIFSFGCPSFDDLPTKEERKTDDVLRAFSE